MTEMACGNCEWTGTDEQCVMADDVRERHETGCIYSSEECPECGSLCYPTDTAQSFPYIGPHDELGWADWLRQHIGEANALAVARRLIECDEPLWRIMRNGKLYARRETLGEARSCVSNARRIAGEVDEWQILDGDGTAVPLRAGEG